jgi:hypothetical protein
MKAFYLRDDGLQEESNFGDYLDFASKDAYVTDLCYEPRHPAAEEFYDRMAQQNNSRYYREYYAIADRFVWITDRNEHLMPCQMATPHLFYALRMLFNNTVAPVFRIEQADFIRHNGVREWPTSYIERAAEELLRELDTRTDIEQWQQDQIDDMLLNAELIRKIQIV